MDPHIQEAELVYILIPTPEQEILIMRGIIHVPSRVTIQETLLVTIPEQEILLTVVIS